jgi:hypothetical protein
MKAILVVGILTVQNGWVIDTQRTEVLAPTMEACERMRQAVVQKKQAAKATNYYAICRPDWVRS